jgi:hypothetical protein
MAALCELWELQVEIVKDGGSYIVRSRLWRSPQYPTVGDRPLSVTEIGDRETLVVADPLEAVASLAARLGESASADGDSKRMTRITLRTPPELDGVDWERPAAPHLVVRLAPQLQQRRSTPSNLRLPLEVRLFDGFGVARALADEMFKDPHLDELRNSGIRFLASEDRDAPIFHVFAASPDDPAVVAALDLLRDGYVRPLLVILQTISGPGAGPSSRSAAGPTVLEVDFDFQFVRDFYRSLMRDWSIDTSVAWALGPAHARRYRLWSDGNERRSLLSSAVLEAARAIEPVAPRWTDDGTLYRRFGPSIGLLRPPTRSGRFYRGQPFRAFETTERRVDRRVVAAMRDFHAHVDKVVSDRRAGLDAAVRMIELRAMDLEGATGVRRLAEIQAQTEQVAQAQRARVGFERADPTSFEAALARFTNLWLRDSEAERDLPATEPLVRGRIYSLAVKIGRHVSEARVAAAFPEAELVEVFKEHDRIALDVVVFSPAEDFELDGSHGTLLLPRIGDSETAEVRLVPLRAGSCRLRICIYHRARLLQSAFLEAEVVDPRQEGGRAEGPNAIEAALDYVGTADFALLDKAPSPAATIFTNHGADGSHWLGVYAPEAGGFLSERSGRLFTVSDEDATRCIERVNDRFDKIAMHGDGEYRFANEKPSAEDWEEREHKLVALARDGRRMFRQLMGGDDLMSTRTDVEQPAVLSIGRCRDDRLGIPWAAFYDLGLDTALPEGKQSLCAVFSEQARAGRDLLDDPAACRAQRSCPLRKPDAEARVVCPLGFWGARHQIEQPLHHITPPQPGEPKPAKPLRAESVSHIPRGASGKIRVACGSFEFPPGEVHPADLKPALDVDSKTNREDVLTLIKTSGYPVVYFFCHGRKVENDLLLQVGPGDEEQYIGPDSLTDPFEWREPRPLVFLNGCDTVAFDSKSINGLTKVFRAKRAAGIIGTEFAVPRQLARVVGKRVLEHLAAGKTLGTAFLETRRALLRQLNPLGLAYSAYASAWLHCAADANCPQCRSGS